MADDEINYALGMADTSADASSGGTDSAIKAALRYKDGYRVARFTDGMGTAFKIVGAIIGMIVIGLGVWAGSSNFSSSVEPILFLVSLLLGVMAGGILFVLGVLASAVGQQLKAALDSAVNSSPFLDVPAKARVMSLD